MEDLKLFIRQLIREAIQETRNNPDVHIDTIAKWQDHKLAELDDHMPDTKEVA
jgi:hypothetical protein